MRILYNWLKEFVEVKASPADLRTRLSLVGIAIDTVEDSIAGPLLDAEITANRPDCLGHYGMAREVAAIFRQPLNHRDLPLKEAIEQASALTSVTIESPDLCGRYTARLLRGVKIQPSPDWLRQRLTAIGQNSINNVVDATNYVMFELGQPLHAFDFDRLADRRIVVRRARPGEKIRTLDGIERVLGQGMCVISDASRAVAIGGVMGGADSEIGFASRNLLIESAWFDPISVRHTSKALGLRSEASYRFERGSDPEMAERASRRAAELIQQLAGGEILAGVVDLYPRREPPLAIELARKELLRVMGEDIPDRDVEEILSALGFHPVRKDRNRGSAGSILAVWECQQPSWRRDVTRGIDLIEEVARHYGYDKFPPRLPPAKQPARERPHTGALDRLRERLVALGYQEIVAIPLVDRRRDEIFRAPGTTPAVIGNPLAEDASVMRSSGAVSMVAALEWNLNHGQRNLRLFEVGKAYELSRGQPVETGVLTLGATGLAGEKTIYAAARAFSFADLKGDLDSVGHLAGGDWCWDPATERWLDPAQAGQIRAPRSSPALGIAGLLAPQVADQLKLRQHIFLAELRLEPLLRSIEAAEASRRFEPLPRFPAVERDFSLVLEDGVVFARVVEVIRSLAIPEVRQVQAADLFRGGQIPAGKFSLMIRVTLQRVEATLTDAQIADTCSRIVAALERELGATLRAS
jgi:phenylalanyl-tRNA synthetase beta chain